MFNAKITKIIIYGSSAVIIFILFFILKFENNITVNGKLVSEKEWILSKRPDGSLIATLYDRQNNIVNHSSVFQIERGEIFTFDLNSYIINNSYITPTDTIGVIQSSETYSELTALEKELAIAKGNLKINLTGKKTELINQAENEVELAKERLFLQNKIYKNKAALYDKKLISEIELDNEKNIQKIYELQMQITQSNLNNLKTGSKPEQIQMIREEISSIESEIKVLLEKMKNYILFSPIKGTIYKSFAEDTIVYIGSEEKVLIMPIDIGYREDIKKDQSVTINNYQFDGIVSGTIVDIGEMIKLLNNKQTIIATAVLNKNYQNIPLNLILECEINTESKTGFEHFLRYSKNIFY